jgi:putative ABC transport system substrate-binding protein
MAERLRPSLRMPTRRAAFRLGAGLMLAPAAARGQEAGRTYRLGFVTFNPRSAPIYVGLFEELVRAGFVEGGNLTVDPQGFSATPERLREVVEAVVAKAPDAIVCSGDPIARIALQATKTIPIVANCDDLVRNELVASL